MSKKVTFSYNVKQASAPVKFAITSMGMLNLSNGCYGDLALHKMLDVFSFLYVLGRYIWVLINPNVSWLLEMGLSTLLYTRETYRLVMDRLLIKHQSTSKSKI